MNPWFNGSLGDPCDSVFLGEFIFRTALGWVIVACHSSPAAGPPGTAAAAAAAVAEMAVAAAAGGVS